MISISLTSVFVDDQERALAFYTDVLGFVPKNDVPLGEYRWLTVVSPGSPDGPELLLEPDSHPATAAFKQALVADGIPFASFAVDDIAAFEERLATHSVRVVQPATQMGPVVVLRFDDTCGNLIQVTAPS